MIRLKINELLECFYMVVMLTLASCAAKTDHGGRPEPVIDLKAKADLQDSYSDFNQVLLRIEMLHTHADITKYGISTPEEHQSRLSYYRTAFKDDIYLIDQNDTIPCFDVHAERLYMDLPYMNFVLTFNHKLSEGDELMIRDVVYSNKILLVTIDHQIPAK